MEKMRKKEKKNGDIKRKSDRRKFNFVIVVRSADVLRWQRG